MSGLSDNVAGAIAYILIAGLIFLLIEPYNRNKPVRFHAFQGLFLLGAYIIVNFLLSGLSVLGAFVLIPVAHVAYIGAMLYLSFQTYHGKRIVLPIIGPIAEKQA